MTGARAADRRHPAWWPGAETAKAVVSALVIAAAYLAGVIPAEGGLTDVSTVQWLGLIVFVGGAYGLTYRVPNAPRMGDTPPS